jgi:hypothetical protein
VLSGFLALVDRHEGPLPLADVDLPRGPPTLVGAFAGPSSQAEPDRRCGKAGLVGATSLPTPNQAVT